MQLAADGTPELIDAPAPINRVWGEVLLIPTERTSASSPKIRLSGIGSPILTAMVIIILLPHNTLCLNGSEWYLGSASLAGLT
jgi:hypothetical protein